MGYDMNWENRDDDEADRVAAANESFNAAVDMREKFPRGSSERDLAQKRVDAAYETLLDAETSYFRLNIWGMGRCRGYMAERGMLCEPSYDRSAWDRLPEADDSVDEPWGGAAYDAEVQKILTGHDGECPGIPAHKLGSNDGWHVLPGEITAALKANENHEPPTDCEWWGKWIEWLRGAAEHGGFRVH